MNKKWIYGIVAVILIAGLVYMLVDEKDDMNVVDTYQENKEGPGEPVEEPLEDETVTEKEIEEDMEESPEEVAPLPELPVEDVEFSDIEIGEKLPDFTLKSLDGEDVNLRELEGKIVLINFWATWCPWCDKEMADLDKLDKENEDLIVVGVNVDEPKAQVEEYVKEGGYDFKVALDAGGQVSAQYLVTGLPASYFVNEEGIYAGRIPSYMTYEQMEEALKITREY